MLNGKNLKKHVLNNGAVLLEFDGYQSVELLMELINDTQSENEADSLLSDLERNFSDENGSFGYPSNTTKISSSDFDVLLKILRSDEYKDNTDAADELEKPGNRLVLLNLVSHHYSNYKFY